MSLRKIAGLLAAAGIVGGLLGSGVGAAFTDQVQALQNINVGTFSCAISDGGGGVISNAGHTVTYSDFTIMSSAAGSDPFSFTVQNTGSIPDVLTVTPSGLGDAKFSVIGDPFAAVPLAAGATHTYNTGVQWTELSNANLNEHGSVTLTVNCGENAPAVIFDNHPAALPSNLPSIGPEAYSYKEFGAQVQFAGSARKLSTATVTMSSWACESGSWTVAFGNAGACITTPGTTYNVPITFNVYADASNAAAHTPIVTRTQTFAIPYRPSSIAGGDDKAWNAAGSHGIATNITFSFSGETLPDTAIFGITFNTDNHGYAPLGGSNSPTDSLNVAMYPGTGDGSAAVAPAVGSFLPDGKSAYLNDTYAPFYLDGGAGGVGTFRLDTGASTTTSIGAYGGYEPAVQITATN
jgi:hypothetical protein